MNARITRRTLGIAAVLALVAVLAVPFLADAQLSGTISGQVTGRTSGAPISGVTLNTWTSGGPTYSTTTDASGNYSFTVPYNVAGSLYVVKIFCSGALPIQKSTTLSNTNPNTSNFNFKCSG